MFDRHVLFASAETECVACTFIDGFDAYHEHFAETKQSCTTIHQKGSPATIVKSRPLELCITEQSALRLCLK